MEISFKLNDKEVRKKLTAIEQKQLPYATARALTETVQIIGKRIVENVNAKMNTRGKWAGRLANAKLNGELSLSGAWNAVPANKKDGINKMRSSIGTIGWQMAQQADERNTLRVPLKSKFLYKPIQGKNTKANGPKMRFYDAKKSNRIFVQNTSKGLIVLRRTGKVIP